MAHIFMGGSVQVNTFELGQRHTPMSGSQGVPFEPGIAVVIKHSGRTSTYSGASACVHDVYTCPGALICTLRQDAHGGVRACY